MIINKNTKIVGNNVVLVPYRKEHVLKYHEWMKSEELQTLTASEPLTLEQEYEMQQSWMRDDNKCTFIILDKNIYDSKGDEIDAMIGDTNLFFANGDSLIVAEAEIMIAEPWARGRHCGWEAMLLMFLYGINVLGVKQYIVKISMDNMKSIQMFQKMGFIETSTSEVFKEITLEKIVDSSWTQWLNLSVELNIINEDKSEK